MRAAAPQFQRRNRSGVLAADHRDIHLEIRMRINVIVLNLAQVFAGNVHEIWQVIIAGRDNKLAGFDNPRAAKAVLRMHGKRSISTRNPLHALVLPHVEFVVGGHESVVLQRLIARGLGVGTRKRNPADLQPLRGGEESHMGRVVKEGVAEAALVDQYGPESGLLGFDGAG